MDFNFFSISFHLKIVTFCLSAKYFPYSSSFEFDQNYIGVSFRPYVRQSVNGKFNYSSYTYENIKIMFTVLAGNFTKVFVRDSYALEDEYIFNVTYNEGSYASVYSGEVAARINRESGRKVLTVLYEAFVTESVNRAIPEIQLAFEAAVKANQIYPDTVEGIILGKKSLNILHTFRMLNYFKGLASQLKLKLGAELESCFAFFKKDENKQLFNIQLNITAESDIISCRVMLPENPAAGPVASFESIAKQLLAFRQAIKMVNPNVEVIGNVKWSSGGLEEWETVDNLKIYWETASEWAAAQNYTVYLEEAFDNPWRDNPWQDNPWSDNPPDDAHLGWWRLKDSSQINSVEGYEEKFSGNIFILMYPNA